MSRYIILCCFIVAAHFTSAQDWFFNKADTLKDSLPPKSFLQIRYQVGTISDSRTDVINSTIGSNPFQSIDLRYGIYGYGRKNWHQLHRYPTYGLGVGKYFFQPADNIVGNPISTYMFFNETLFQFKKSSISYDIAVGFAYNWKPYDPVTNPDQLVIGSKVTAFLVFNLQYEFQLSERINANLGFGINHFSNGRFRSPNRGLNLYGLNASIRYNLGTLNPVKIQPRPIEPFTPFIEFDLVGSIGTVSTFQDKANPSIYYMTGSVTLDVSRHYGYKGKYGIGLDWFYDESLKTDYQNQYPNGVPENLLYWPGIHLSHEYMIHRWAIITQAGLNLKLIDVKGTGFARVALRYDVSKSIFLRVGLRVYKNVIADFVEWGVGYSYYKK